MKRGWQWVLNLAGGLLLFLAVGVAGLWVWSYWREVVIAKYDAGMREERVVLNNRGRIGFVSYNSKSNRFEHDPAFFGFEYHIFDSDPSFPVYRHNFLGFGWASIPPRDKQVKTEFAIPHWLFLTLAAALPGIRLVRFIRRRPHGPGLRQTCGYDLRATPTDVRSAARRRGGGAVGGANPKSENRNQKKA